MIIEQLRLDHMATGEIVYVCVCGGGGGGGAVRLLEGRAAGNLIIRVRVTSSLFP